MLVALSRAAPALFGCAGNNNNSGANLPPVDDTRSANVDYRERSSAPAPPANNERRGLSTGQKVASLAGAAALYYMYRKSQQRQGEGKQANTICPRMGASIIATTRGARTG